MTDLISHPDANIKDSEANIKDSESSLDIVLAQNSKYVVLIDSDNNKHVDKIELYNDYILFLVSIGYPTGNYNKQKNEIEFSFFPQKETEIWKELIKKNPSPLGIDWSQEFVRTFEGDNNTDISSNISNYIARCYFKFHKKDFDDIIIELSGIQNPDIQNSLIGLQKHEIQDIVKE